jgi:hypothetical protein
MKEYGLILLLVTGDHHRSGQAVPGRPALRMVRSQVLPLLNAEIVRDIQSDGGRVTIVCDGINDAPALMQADVGIAIGPASNRKTVENLRPAFFLMASACLWRETAPGCCRKSHDASDGHCCGRQRTGLPSLRQLLRRLCKQYQRLSGN